MGLISLLFKKLENAGLSRKMNEKTQQLARQVAGKIHWGDSAEDVREWLLAEKNISGEQAEELIAQGLDERRREVRGRAMVRLVCASVGLVVFGLYLYLQYLGEFIVVGIGVAAVWGIGIASTGIVLHSLYEILTGESDRPM